MGILDIIIVLFLIVVVYFVNEYMNTFNNTTRQPMQTITELRHHTWLIRTGMREHAENFNGFGLKHTIRIKKGRRGLIRWI